MPLSPYVIIFGVIILFFDMHHKYYILKNFRSPSYSGTVRNNKHLEAYYYGA